MSALAKAIAGQLEADHRGDELYKALKLSVAMLKKAGVDTEKFTQILKEYKK